MTNCSCNEHGFCKRRNCFVTRRHFQHCQAGRVEEVDTKYERMRLEIARRSGQPKSQKEWPLWAQTLSKFKASEDKGLGDTIERSLGSAGIAFKVIYKKIFKRKCGCQKRKNHLNKRYPYIHEIR